MPTVLLPYSLQRFSDGGREVEARGWSLREVLDGLERQFPGLAEQLVDESGALRRYVTVLVGEQDARKLGGLDAQVGDGETVTILPAIAGGEATPVTMTQRLGHREASAAWLARVIEHCVGAWPSEACGLVFAKGLVHRVATMCNALDPNRARHGYAMDPLELFGELRGAERRGERLVAIYHSHPDGPACFSESDRSAALGDDGRPLWPEVAYLVVGMREGRVESAQSFEWDGRDFAAGRAIDSMHGEGTPRP